MDAYFPIDEYEDRWRRAEAALVALGLEAAVVWGRSAGGFERSGDLFYLTGYYGTHSGQGLDTPVSTARGIGCCLLRVGHEPELMADEPDPNPDLIACERIHWAHDTIRGIADLLQRRGIGGRVGFVGSDFFPIKYWPRLTDSLPDVDWQVHDDLVRELRVVKSPRELDACRAGGAVAGRALDLLMRGLIAGKREAEAAADAAYEVTRAGGHVHMIPCNHGALLHYFARDPLNGYSQDAPSPGELVRGWVYGPMIKGYWMDPGRTAVCGGRPTRDQRRLVEATAGIVERLIAEIRPGRTMGEIASIGEAMAADFGGVKDQAAEKWPHFGHGVGLFFEKPYISNVMGTADEPFRERMVIGVEAFLTAPGTGSAGHEENVIVTATGTERITTSPVLYW